MTDQDTGSTLGSEAELGAKIAAEQAQAGIGTTQVDANALLAEIKAMQARLAQLEAEKATTTAPALVNTAESLRNLLGEHALRTLAGDYAPVLALADDAVDAARNAVTSGDVTYVRQIGDRIARWMRSHAPHPGENHYWRQALDFAEHHLPDAADNHKPSPAPAAGAITTDKAPAAVIPGSVTG